MRSVDYTMRMKNLLKKEKNESAASNNQKNNNNDSNVFMSLLNSKGIKIGTARFITHSALIAAAYAALTIGLAPISFGQQQVRIAEALAILPAFTPAAIPGLFIGCAIANTVSFMGLPDLIFGSLATLISAQLTYMIAKALSTAERGVLLQAALLPLPAVVVNTFVIGAMLSIFFNISFWLAAVGVLTGQALSCYGLGVPLYFLLRESMRRAGARHAKAK